MPRRPACWLSATRAARRLSDRRRERRHGLHVHDDEQGAAYGRRCRALPSRNGRPSRPSPMHEIASRRRAVQSGRRIPPDHRASRRAAHVAEHAGADARRARDLLRDRRAIDRAAPSADEDSRQVANERASLLTPSPRPTPPMSAWRCHRSACRSMAAWAISRRPAPLSTSATRESLADLRRHQRHSGDRPSDAQIRLRKARPCGRILPICAGPWRRSGRPTIRPSARPPPDLARRSIRLSAQPLGSSAGRSTTRRWPGATPYLRLFATATGGALLAEEALAAARVGTEPEARIADRAVLCRASCARLLWTRARGD